MKKFSKLITTLVLALFVCITLSGCNVYFDYDDSLPFNNVYETIKLGKLTKMLKEQATNEEKNEIVYVMYATNEEVTCVNAVKTFDEQAKQYGVETIYYLDATKYYSDNDGQDKIEEELGINDASSCPAVLMFVDGALVLDWTRTSIKNKYDSSLTKYAYELFIERPATLE